MHSRRGGGREKRGGKKKIQRLLTHSLQSGVKTYPVITKGKRKEGEEKGAKNAGRSWAQRSLLASPRNKEGKKEKKRKGRGKPYQHLRRWFGRGHQEKKKGRRELHRPYKPKEASRNSAVTGEHGKAEEEGREKEKGRNRAPPPV